MAASAQIVMSGNSTPIYFSTGRKNLLDVGGGTTHRVLEFYPDGYEIFTLDKKLGWDIDKQGLPEGPWSLIFANHIIEHVHDPDFFLLECKRVMDSSSILEIGTPNLAAWFNRIFFLFGYVPHSMELSKRFNVGKPFDWNKEELGGHIYVYTPQALVQLLKHHGFYILSVKGERSTFPCQSWAGWMDRVLTDLSPSLASAFRIKCTL